MHICTQVCRVNLSADDLFSYSTSEVSEVVLTTLVIADLDSEAGTAFVKEALLSQVYLMFSLLVSGVYLFLYRGASRKRGSLSYTTLPLWRTRQRFKGFLRSWPILLPTAYSHKFLEKK